MSRSRPALRRAPTSDRAIFFPRSTVRDLTLASPRLTRVASHRSEFFATEPRLLRAAVAAFLDLLNLSTRTIEEFGHVPAQVAEADRVVLFLGVGTLADEAARR